MLTKMISLRGVGLFSDVSAKKTPKLSDVVLIYAENGRGKSTLTDVLQSCVSQDPTLVLARKTIDGQGDPEVKLLFEQEIATFAGGEWAGHRPEALVYNTAFVTRNVYAGDFVDTEHRANLLDFALGSAAVEAREKEQAASEKQRSEAANRRLLEAKLEALAGKGVSLSDFRALPEDPEIEDKIARTKKDLLAAQRSQQILGQAVPVLHQLPELGVEAILKTLETTLEATHREAEEKVRAHAASLGAAGESWLREGTALAKSDDCPFCGQDVVGVDLVAMYRLVFNEAYERLERDVRSASLASARLSGDALINEFRSRAERNAEVLSQWREHVEVLGPGDDGECLLSELFTELFQEVSAAVDKKEKRISTNPLTGEQHERILQLTEKVEQVYRSHNEQISEALQSVSEFQGSVGRSDAKAEQQKLRNLELVKLRHEESAEAVVQELVECEAREVEARAEKDKARDELSDLMNLVLGKFQGGVNEYLERFNASFRINKLNHSYRGKVPRAEYEIVLRDAALGFGGGYPSFAKGLSDGDKKTLGFAFFAASTLADPELGGKIVVFDDPVSSLDRPRRAATIATLVEIAEHSAQLIVLAHDAYFLRDLRTKLRKAGAGQVSELAVRGVADRYSDIFPGNLDELCQSEYLRNYRTVRDVESGELNSPEEVAQAAVALRPLVEGYLHRKFPDSIPEGQMLGQAIGVIADRDDPMCATFAMRSRLDELRSLNDYASMFHHDRGPDMDAARNASQSEVMGFCKRVLRFIHES